MGQRKFQKENKKVFWNEWEWRYNILKNPCNASKAMFSGKFIAVNA